jgi:hypothetical protein
MTRVWAPYAEYIFFIFDNTFGVSLAGLKIYAPPFCPDPA